MSAPDATIRAWLDKADVYPTPTGAVGWVINGPELIALLSECTPRVPASVRPARVSDDMTTFYVQATLTFARSELTKETPMPGRECARRWQRDYRARIAATRGLKRILLGPEQPTLLDGGES